MAIPDGGSRVNSFALLSHFVLDTGIASVAAAEQEKGICSRGIGTDCKGQHERNAYRANSRETIRKHKSNRARNFQTAQAEVVARDCFGIVVSFRYSSQ